jgi:hypothetical protein
VCVSSRVQSLQRAKTYATVLLYGRQEIRSKCCHSRPAVEGVMNGVCWWEVLDTVDSDRKQHDSAFFGRTSSCL